MLNVTVLELDGCYIYERILDEGVFINVWFWFLLRVGAGRNQGCAISQSIINGSLPNFQQ